MGAQRIAAVFILGAIACGGASSARGQAWVKAKDGYYFKTSASFLSSSKEFDFHGDRREIFADDPARTRSSFRDVSINAYLEYGLSDRFTLVATVPFKIVTSKATTMITGEPVREDRLTNGGLGDLLVSVRAPLRQKGFAASLQGGIKLPLGYEQQPDNDGPPLGSGEIDFEGHLLLGLSLYPRPAYLGASAGYRVRGGPLHDEVIYSAEGGYTLDRFFLKLRFDGLQNVEVPPDLSGGAGNGVIVGDQNIFKISPTVEYQLNDHSAVSAELFHTLAGRNTVAGTAFTLGLVYTR